jgi:hypothetical protein
MDWIYSIFFTPGCFVSFDPITLIGLAMSLTGGVGSMIGSAGANKKRQAALNAEKADSKAYFDKEYYTSELDRTENQSMLRTLTDKLKEQTQRANATNAITGATPEVALAQHNNANKAYADTVNKLAGMASQRKSFIAAQARADKRALYQSQDAIDYAKAQSWANLGSNAAGLGASALMAGAYGKGTGLTGEPGKPGKLPGLDLKDITEGANYDNLG